jgi:hypothetical protein
MSGYFSFQKLITPTIVKAVYFLGFIILSTLSITLIVWAGLRLNDANITRQLGWRYVAVGAAGLIIGNIIWRVICELWMVLFSIDNQLSSTVNSHSVQRIPDAQFVERRVSMKDRRVVNRSEESASTRETRAREKEAFKSPGPASVLGLS